MRNQPVSISIEPGEHVSGVLSIPEGYRSGEGKGIIVAHGAGNDMNSPLIVFFCEGLAEAGHLSLRFNFPYREKGRKAPDQQNVLVRTWQKVFDFLHDHPQYLPGKILAAGLFPFILLFLHRGLARRRLAYFIFAGGVGGIAALHAHFQLTYYAGVVALVYLLCHLIWQRHENGLRGTTRMVGYSVVGAAFAGGLALMKFLPIFGSLEWGSRGGIERGYEFATSWSLPPMELMDLVTPHFSGLLGNYWGVNYFKLDTQYLGILPLLLALVGVVFKYRERYVKFFLGLGIVVLLDEWAGIQTVGALGDSLPSLNTLLLAAALVMNQVVGIELYFLPLPAWVLAIGLFVLLSKMYQKKL